MKNRALLSLQDGTRSGKSGDKIDYSFYDTATLAIATTQHRLFTQQLGGTKNLADTNMKQGGVMPSGQRFTAHAIKVMYFSAAAKPTAFVQSYYDLLRNTTLQIILAGKDDYGTFTLAELMGASEYVALTPTAAGDNIPKLSAVVKGVFPLNIPVVLAAMQTFEITMTHQVAVVAGLVGDFVKVSLNGRLERLS